MNPSGNAFALFLAAAIVAIAGCAAATPAVPNEVAKKQVADTERAFARTMADRDLKAFESFLSRETVFFSGPKPLHGSQAVVAFWSKFYAGPKAPFSWAPDQVEVLASGNLAISSGPVHDPEGKLVGGSRPCGGRNRRGSGRSSSTRARMRATARSSARGLMPCAS